MAGFLWKKWNGRWESVMNKLLLSQEARKDLREIFDYISKELENPEAAQHTIAGITQKLHLLEQHSEIGARLGRTMGLESEYRYLICGNYYVFYRTHGDNVYIDRIMYHRRDFMRVLFGLPNN